MKRLFQLIWPTSLLWVTGLLCWFTPLGQQIEESIGLSLLFRLRGPLPPPQGVVIVNMDDHADSSPALPEKFSKWPRSVHARMVDRLAELGADVIAFDVFFAEPRDLKTDQALASAMRRAGNVILFEELIRDPLTATAADTRLALESLVEPAQIFADAAVALAPHPLPKLPVRINQAWLFKNSSGHIATLPSMTLLVHALADLQPFLPETVIAPPSAGAGQTRRAMAAASSNLRELMRHQPALHQRLRSQLHCDSTPDRPPTPACAAVNLYAGPETIYLNYYGPPATIPTLRFDRLLQEQPPTAATARLIRDKAVFIGSARRTWAGQKDGFYTVFSQKDGLDLSGVELAATAYANLLEDRPLTSLPTGLTVILLGSCALTVVAICRFTRPLSAFLLLSGSGGAYLLISSTLFANRALWPPLMTPLLLQPGIAFAIALLWHYARAGRERENFRQALGYYLPNKAVDALSRDLSFIKSGDHMIYGACLMTDAQNYTTLSERLDPMELGKLIKEYYSRLFDPVRRHEGVISDVVGDSMLALWLSAHPNPKIRLQACRAAQEIPAAIGVFNQEHPGTRLPTRVGLHFGYMLMGNIGAADHFEYTPVGDIVNTVSRIEQLNKPLGTTVLATEEAVTGLTGLQTRPLGAFLLAGKSLPVVVHELLTQECTAAPAHQELLRHFAEARELFVNRQWDDAVKIFDTCLSLAPDDGPSLFYRKQCLAHRRIPPPDDWQGAIRIGKD